MPYMGQSDELKRYCNGLACKVLRHQDSGIALAVDLGEVGPATAPRLLDLQCICILVSKLLKTLARAYGAGIGPNTQRDPDTKIVEECV